MSIVLKKSLLNIFQEPEIDDSKFYEPFKMASSKIIDLNALVLVSNLDSSLKTTSSATLQQASLTLGGLSKIQIKITQQLYNLQRDTMRTIQELSDAFLLLESLKWPCKGPAYKSYDKFMRGLEKLCFFWEQLATLENRNSVVSYDKFLSTELNEQIDAWIEKLKTEVQGSMQSVRKGRQLQQDIELKNAHELFTGLGTEKNQVKGLQIYGKLAEEQNPTAQAIMGQILIEGQLGTVDYDKAFNYLKLSADQGNKFSVYWASRLILEEKVFNKFFDGCKAKDCDLAIKLLRKAAELGHAPSMNYLGDIYWHGLVLKDFVLEKDLQNAEYFFKLAQKKNSVEAIYKLALLYQEMSKSNLNKNRRQFIYPLLNQAKNLDYLPAFYDLGMLLLNGLGEDLVPNPVMAELIFEQAALKGDVKSATKLLNLRFQSLKKAEISADDFLSLLDNLEIVLTNESIINYMRGKVYSKGIQCDKNLKKGIEELRIGAWKGCLKCKAHISKIEYDQPRQGFIDQIKHSWRKSYQKRDRSTLPNSIEENQSTRPDRHTLTLSIVKEDRKRYASDYKIEGSVLLSQMKMQELGSPRRTLIYNKDRFSFQKKIQP